MKTESTKRNKKLNYYDILGIDKTASSEDIKRAYRRQAMKYHPDRNKSPTAEETFKLIAEAYSVLSDNDKRQLYNNTLYYEDMKSFNRIIERYRQYNNQSARADRIYNERLKKEIDFAKMMEMKYKRMEDEAMRIAYA